MFKIFKKGATVKIKVFKIFKKKVRLPPQTEENIYCPGPFQVSETQLGPFQLSFVLLKDVKSEVSLYLRMF